MAFNILGGIDFVQQQGEQGRQRYADRLLGQAYAAPPEQRQSALAKLAGTDGRLAMDAGAAFQAQDDNAADRRNKLLTSRAGVMFSLPKEQRALMWPSVRADLVRNDPELAALPETYDDAQFGPVIEKLAGGGGNSEMFSQKVGADGFIYNTDRQGNITNTGVKADRQMWFANNEGVDPYIVDKSGGVRMVGPGQQQAPSQQPSQIAAPNGDPKADAITQAANAMVAAGVPEAQVDAFIQQSLSAAGLQPQAAPADAGAMIPTSGGGGGPAPSGAPVAPPARQPTMADIPINELGGGPVGAPNPLRRPASTPTANAPPSGYRARPDGTLEFIPGGPADPNTRKVSKPMPAAVLKLREETLSEAETAQTINMSIDRHLGNLRGGKLQFGPIDNLVSQARNFTGQSTEQSRNFAEFRSDLEKLRNDSLRLNAGVQTDGDAQRAWNELFANLNDEKLVEQRLNTIRKLNERAALLKQASVERIDEEYGNGPSEQPAQQQPASGGWGITRVK